MADPRNPLDDLLPIRRILVDDVPKKFVRDLSFDSATFDLTVDETAKVLRIVALPTPLDDDTRTQIDNATADIEDLQATDTTLVGRIVALEDTSFDTFSTGTHTLAKEVTYITGASTIHLPTVSGNSGRTLVVHLKGVASLTVDIVSGGGEIYSTVAQDGAATYKFAGSASFHCDGTDWNTVAASLP